MEIYERESGRSLEWTSSGTYNSMMFKGSGILYTIPTEKEVNKRVKTKDWRWVSDELGERWIETKKKKYHIGCFHKPEVIFLKIRRLDVATDGGKNA